MIGVGDRVPDRKLTVITRTIEVATVETLLEAGPIALAFFPAAFTEVCTLEMCRFRDDHDTLPRDDSVVGVSVDSPFVLQTFKEEYDLPQPFVSDFNRELIDLFGISIDFADIGIRGLAQRAVFCLDDDRTVTYAWIADDPGQEPPYGDVFDELADLTAI